MHRLKARSITMAGVAGLIGLVALVFGLMSTTNGAQATTPDNGWKLIGQIVKVKADGAPTVLHATIAANAKTVALIKGANVIIKSNPADPAKDYPHSWTVVAYKAPDLYLQIVPPNQCVLPAPPAAVPATATQNLYTGPCPKPVVGTGAAADLSGVYDIVDDNGQPGVVDFYHCIARFDIDNSGAVKSAMMCFDNSGTLANGGSEPINDPPGEGVGNGAVGPPPPPPYSVFAPAKGTGTYNAGTDTLVTTTCFPDVGKSVNIIARATTQNAHAALLATGKMPGSVDIYLNQTNAACSSLTPAGSPGTIARTVYPARPAAACPGAPCVHSPYRLEGNVLHGYPDWDMDGCTDSDELWQDKPNSSSKCADDPWNPNDYTGGTDVSGSYDIQAVAVRQDAGAPGSYYTCKADIQQNGKDLTVRLLCYADSPAVVVNPAAVPAPNTNAVSCPPAPATYCGDGISGSPPPGVTTGTYPTNSDNFAVIKTKHTELTGVLDNAQNVIKLHGCFQAPKPSVDGNVYWDAVINAHTGHGSLNRWTEAAQGLTNANCVLGAPSLGSAPPGVTGAGTIMPLHIVRQASKAALRDSDGDGCPDKRELAATQGTGGLRDPSNHYDYFNTFGNAHQIRVDDILAVVHEFFHDDPPGVPDMKSGTDRTPIMNANAWNLGPPNGQQRVDDILAVVKQFFHDC